MAGDPSSFSKRTKQKMIIHDINCIFIHIPKTAGNFLQSQVFSKYSKDQIVLFGHQDGVDRFEVRGDVTSRKHMSVQEYAESIDISNYIIISSVRDPIDRLKSLYFSPHRWKKLGTKAKAIGIAANILDVSVRFDSCHYIDKRPYFDEDDFLKMIKNTPTQKCMLYGHENSAGTYLIYYNSIETNLHRIAKALSIDISKIDFNKKINKGLKNFDKRKNDTDKKMDSMILNSKHAEDYDLFEK